MDKDESSSRHERIIRVGRRIASLGLGPTRPRELSPKMTFVSTSLDWSYLVTCDLIRWVDDEPQPGVVEAAMVDASGTSHRVIAKWVDFYFTPEDLSRESTYPQPAALPCGIQPRASADLGDVVDVKLLWDTTEGRWNIEVPRSSLIRRS